MASDITKYPFLFRSTHQRTFSDAEAKRCGQSLNTWMQDAIDSQCLQPVEISICGYRWWEEGEQYECLMGKGHKIIKHGQRGMARRVEE